MRSWLTDLTKTLGFSIAAFCFSGCTGDVGPGAARGEGSAPGGSGGGVASGGTGSGGTSSTEAPFGFSTMGRLNRTQYNNTVRDLLGTALTPADDFPADELVLGFDTIAGVLRVQPEHIQAYLSASYDLMAEFWARPATDPWRTRYVTCDIATGAACYTTVLRNFASAAWRRPATDEELAPYVALATGQADPTLGLSTAMRAVLTSAKFLFRIELDSNVEDATPHALGAYEVATRLSYALWSTMPDADLFSAAQSGALLQADGVLTQTRRLLDSGYGLTPLVDNFMAQWLNVNQVLAIVPDATLFPEFTDELRQDMIAETKLFAQEFLGSSLPVTSIFNADFTYLNQRLAQHYGVAGVTSPTHQRVALTGTNRRGLLTLGSYLAATSNPTRTSPVKRGLYVLDRLLCEAPPPPPPGVDVNIDQGSGLENLSVRERLAEHQAKGAGCAGCHVLMDTIGLGLEKYDAVGKYRESDEFGPIDATGQLPSADGTTTTPFDGAQQLADMLATDPRTLTCAVEKLMTYTLGRQFGPDQDPLKQAIASAATASGGSLRAAIETLVVNDVFLKRRAALATEVTP
jgi:hypothetical protein